MAKENTSHDVGMIACTAWEYDLSKFSRTHTSEFNLVCGREELLSIGQTVYFFGELFSGPIFGVLSDRFGRKSILIVAVLMMAVSGLGSGLIPNFELFLVCRFFTAMGAIGELLFSIKFISLLYQIVSVAFSLGMTYILELCGRNWTTYVGIGYQLFWVIGWLSLGGLEYVLTDWRLLTIATSAPGILVVFYAPILLESPRWLLSVGRVEDAECITRTMASRNGRSVPLDWKLNKSLSKASKEEKNNSNKASFLDLFRTPQMCGKTLILYGNWFVVSLTFYGLTLNSTHLGNDFHVNFMIKGALEFPAYVIAFLLVRYTGRRVPYSSSLALSGKQSTSNSSLVCI